MNIQIWKISWCLALLTALACSFGLKAQAQLPVVQTGTDVDFEWRQDGSIIEEGANTSATNAVTTTDIQLGSRFIWYPAHNALRAGAGSASETSTNVGTDSVALGDETLATGANGIALGTVAKAEGDGSVALGTLTTAVSYQDTAMGDFTTASGGNSTAMGFSTMAEGYNSTSMGANTTASGEQSTAMGSYTGANSYDSLVIGSDNVGLSETGTTPSLTSWVATDPLFEIGNGTSSVKDALIVYKNGDTTINGTNNEMPNQTLVNSHSVLTEGLADSRYMAAVPSVLDVSDSASNQLLIGQDATSGSYNSISLNGSLSDGSSLGISGGASGDSSLYLNTPGSGNIYFRTDGVTGANGAMTILSNQNVGIGNTSPQYTLDVNGSIGDSATDNVWVDIGNAYGSGYLKLGDRIASSGLGHFIDFNASSGVSGWSTGARIGSVVNTGGSSSSADLRFYTGGTTQNMIITQSGNVGIGTASPQALLDVEGTVMVGGSCAVLISPKGDLSMGSFTAGATPQ